MSPILISEQKSSEFSIDDRGIKGDFHIFIVFSIENSGILGRLPVVSHKRVTGAAANRSPLALQHGLRSSCDTKTVARSVNY
jgi:hypothetical protein